MDLTELVRHVASEVFVADNDGFLGNWGMNNFYLYRLATDHLFRFIDWDKSEAFKDTPDYWIWHNHLDTRRPTRNRLWTRVMAYPDLKTHVSGYAAGVRECGRRGDPAAATPDDTRGWLEREVDRQYALINAAVLADPTEAVFERSVSGGGQLRARLRPPAARLRPESGRGFSVKLSRSAKC